MKLPSNAFERLRRAWRRLAGPSSLVPSTISVDGSMGSDGLSNGRPVPQEPDDQPEFDNGERGSEEGRQDIKGGDK